MTRSCGRGKPSVLIVGTFLSEAVGNRSVCEDLAVRLQQVGYQVITTSARHGRFERLADMLSTCWNRQRQYDIAQVDVYSGPAFVWAESVCSMLRVLRKPYILTLHGGKLPQFAAKWPRRVRHLLQSAALVTAPSRYLQEQLRAFRRDILLLPNALDMTNYRYQSRSAVKPNMIWMRAFHQVYNPAMAVEVAGLLRKRYPALTLTMAGPDKQDGSLERVRTQVASLKLGDAIRFPGRIPKPEIPDLINSNDIFLNTTSADNTPVSVLEAMACGACIVSTNVGGLRYLLEHERNALMVEPNDAHAMATAVTRLMENPTLSRVLSESARHTCEAFDWPGVLYEWESAFHQVARRLILISQNN